MKSSYATLKNIYTNDFKENFVDLNKIIYSISWAQNPFGRFQIYKI